MNETLRIADLAFEIRRSSRRKTLGLTVDRAGQLVAHAPLTASNDDLQTWIRRKLVWVHKKLATKKELTGVTQHPDFVTGDNIFYLGRNYRLKLVNDQSSPLRFDGQRFLLRRKDQRAAPQHFRRWYLNTGTPWLCKRVDSWASRAGTAASRVTLCELGFRWGSCGRDGSIYFNWRLVQVPPRLIDYVVVHELAHQLERNHTPGFWRILDRVLPDWKDRKSELDREWQSYATFPSAE